MRIAIIRAGLIALLYVQGISLGMLYLFFDQPAASVEPEAIPAALETPDLTATLRVRTPEQHRQIAEQLLLSNDAFQALPHLLNAAPRALPEADEQLLFRIALCLEASRDWSRATAFYRQLVNQTSSPALAAAARNGLARSRIATGQWDQAAQLLWKPWLQISESQFPEYTADAAFLLIRALTTRDPVEPTVWIDPARPINHVPQELNVSREMRQLIAARQAAAQKATAGQEPGSPDDTVRPGSMSVTDVRKFGDQLEDIYLSIETRHGRLLELLKQTARATDLSLNITGRAAELIADQQTSVALGDIDLGSALDALTLPFNLCWAMQDGRVVVLAQTESPGDELERSIQSAALRMLQRVMLMSPDHHAWGHVKFTLATLKQRHGMPDQARQLYQELLDQPVGGKLRQAASFNIGNLYQQSAQWDEASAAYHAVVDANETGEIQAIAWLRIGQLSLESGALTAAIQEFSRAGHCSQLNRVRQLANLRMASCQILNGQPRMARQTMLRRRNWYRQTDLEPAARLVLAIANSELQPSDEVDQELLSMLARNRWTPAQGHELLYLSEHGYRGFGFIDQAVALLDEAPINSMGPWLAYRLTVDRIELLEDSGQHERARQAVSAALQDPRWQSRAELLMYGAEIELALGNAGASLRLCRQILEHEDVPHLHSGALNLMGSIHAERGQHYHAALCFSGLMPLSTEDTPQGPDFPEHQGLPQ